MSFKSYLLEQSLQHQSYNSDLQQFPLPTKPMFDYDTSCSTTSTPSVAEYFEGEVIDELLLILVESLELVSTKTRKYLIAKFFKEIEEETSFEGFIRQRLQNSKAKALSERFGNFLVNKQVNLDEWNGSITTQRGVDHDDSTNSIKNFNTMKALSHKLERFKIRIPDFDVVVVKEEPKGNSETNG